MKQWLHRLLGPSITASLLGAAAYLLYKSLKDVELVELWHALDEFPSHQVFLATLLTFASHIALTVYDYMGVRYIKRTLSYSRVALSAFAAYSISHALGFPALTGGAVRYRYYRRWGLNGVEVAQVMAMAGVTLFLGVFTIGGLALILDGERVERWSELPRAASNGVGLMLLSVVLAYGLISFFWRAPIKIGTYLLKIPTPPFAAAQIIVSAIDWILVASVLYVLLPANDVFSFPTFIGVFVMAYLLGTLSNAPGGLGVFETIIIYTLKDSVPTTAILSALLVYRGVYHVFPLFLGGIALFLSEWHRRRHPVGKQAGFSGRPDPRSQA